MTTLAALLLISNLLATDGAAPPTGHYPSTSHYRGQQLAASAQVTLTEARRLALQVRPGQVTDQALEREPGGSGLRYAFAIKADGKTFKVGVDAQTGRILRNAVEGGHPD